MENNIYESIVAHNKYLEVQKPPPYFPYKYYHLQKVYLCSRRYIRTSHKHDWTWH